ncbi:DEAD/DEAH box helicase (plasmid) [Cupriavidus pinatubonensis]|uniref:DEAD/DEAH box helicase n=1 Tax=Cupriavidus pinatubonensis TaxID=248026 RepID=UPI001C73AECE|nr:DEAD/DEAH box helicase [Cupriavidus pinatubonensis]QYY33546.1 DEAD/DEAH box helicase [Cupriavidus pinatubonensis]
MARPVRFGPKLCLDNVEQLDTRYVGKVMPIYLGIPGRVAGNAVNALVGHVLDQDIDLALSSAVAAICEACGLSDEQILDACEAPEQFSDLEDLLAALHAPATPEEGSSALLVAKRIACLAIQAAALRQNARAPHPDAAVGGGDGIVERAATLLRSQPETPTGDQERVTAGIAAALQGSTPMNGLLCGDVGTGKTLAYLAPAVAAHQMGARVAIVAPTSLLADQIARNLVRRFGDAVAVQRVEAGGKITDPQAILVGTAGLTTVAAKAKYTPNFLIADEQHKLDTNTRERMVAPWTHVLDVSATPIPRTMALSLFPGVQVFTIDEQPVQKSIQTRLIDVGHRKLTVGAIQAAVAAGKRAAILLPRVGSGSDAGQDGEVANRSSVLKAAEQFEKAFPGKVATLYGDMSDEEKRGAIEGVASGRTPIVIASTVFETGIDIPDVAVMVIRDADHFGMSQLHQMRGRLARAGGSGECFLMVEDLPALSPETRNRLEAMTRISNGFELAAHDMVNRGAGEFEGAAQSGATTSVFKLVPIRPRDLLENRIELAVTLDQAEERDDLANRRFSQNRLFN